MFLEQCQVGIPLSVGRGGITSSNMWVHTYDSGKAYGWRKYTTDDDLNARFMNMSDFTIEKIKSIYDTNIPIVG